MGRILLSICCVVVALGLLGASPKPQADAGSENPQHSEQIASSLERLAAAQEQAIQSSEIEEPCDPPGDRRTSDLCAQWKAADAASDAAFWAMLGFWVGLATIFALGLTIWQSHQGLAKAREANDIAHKSAAKQLRAYVHVERAEIRWGNQNADNPQISLFIKNTGQTPARWFGVSSQIVTTNDLDGVDEAPFDAYTFDPSLFVQWPALGAQGDTLSVPGNRNSDRAALVQAFQEDLAVQTFGVLLYETIDGELMESEFWFVSRPPHRHQWRRKDGTQPNSSVLATFGQHEEIPRKMARASRVLKVYQPSERPIPNREPGRKADED